MPRALIVLIVLLIVLFGVLYLLSTQAEEVPTQTIEVDVTGNAQ